MQRAFLFLIIHRYIRYIGLLAWLTLALLVFLFPFSFTAAETTGVWQTLCWWFTQSAGKLGTLIIILVTSFCYTIRFTSYRDKMWTFAKSVSALLIFIGALAFINEHLTKPLLKEPRPSHVFMLKQTFKMAELDSLYGLSKAERVIYFNQLVQNKADVFAHINGKVLSHWVEEAGYSFPSGHTFNAFLLATVMSFSLYHANNQSLHPYFFVPYVWALLVGLSRVALGAHTPLDVTAGGALGLLIATLFIYFDSTRKLILHKKH